MPDNMTYCPNCRCHVEFISYNAMRNTDLDGETITYPVKVAKCTECGDVVPYKPFQEDARLSFSRTVQERTRN